MIKIICDRCGKTIERSCIELRQESPFVDVEDKTWHLCSHCHDDFERFLANKK